MNIAKIVSLNENEKVLKIIRRYWLVYLFSILITFILIAVPFLFIVPLFQWGKFGVVLFLLFICVGLVYGLRVFLSWYLNVFVITNKRIIDVDQKGFLNRAVWDTELNRVQDVTYSQKGLFQTLFHYGNLQIFPSGQTTTKIEIINISKPQKVQELIRSFQEEIAIEEKNNEDILDLSEEDLNNLLDEEIISILNKIKKGAGKKRFGKLIEKFISKDSEN